MKLSFTTLDVFSSKRYAGNPLAIISVPASLSPHLTQEQKQSIATEFNLSESVFLHLPPPGTTSASRKIDIFTTHAEVPFAGHPTVGTAHYLLHTASQSVDTIITKAGPIPISVNPDTKDVKAVIPQDFHVHKVTWPCSLTGKEHPVASIVNGMSFILVQLPDLGALSKASKVRNLNADVYDPSPLDEGWKNGLVGTMYFVEQGVDEFGRKKYRTRMFGTREDPGTGSASCALGCYLAGLEKGEKVSKFAFVQGVEMGRRNEISVEATKKDGGNGIENVVLSGAATTVMEGSLEI